MKSKIALALAALALITLAACGGGGSTPPTTPPTTTPPVVITPGTTTVIYTATTLCASGPALTSTVSQLAADALVPDACPALPATAYANTQVVASVNNGTLTLTVTNLPAGFVSGVLTASSGSTGGVADVNASGSVVTRPGSSINWATNYTGTLVMNFANAPAITIAGSFVTPVIAVVPVVCTAPAMRNNIINQCITAPAATGYTWNNIVGGGIWVADIGVLVTGANLLPATSFVIGDAAWLTAAANGTIKYVKTSSTKADGRPLVYAFYKTTNAPGGNGTTEYYGVIPMYADTIATGGGANQNIGNGTAGGVIQLIKGSINGVKFIATDGCWERAYNGANFVNTNLATPGCSI